MEFHEAQLKQSGVPAALHRRLFTKLKFEDFDVGQKVRIILDQQSKRIGVQSIGELKKDEDIYLVDHAWTFQWKDFAETLRQNPQLITRLENIVQYSDK